MPGICLSEQNTQQGYFPLTAGTSIPTAVNGLLSASTFQMSMWRRQGAGLTPGVFSSATKGWTRRLY